MAAQATSVSCLLCRAASSAVLAALVSLNVALEQSAEAITSLQSELKDHSEGVSVLSPTGGQ